MLFLHLVLAWESRDLIHKGYPDFTIFYSAGKIVGRGLGRSLYDPQTQYRIQREFAAGVSIRQGPLPYNHPPFEALAFVPFARLPYLVAYLLWDFINLLILFGLVPLLRPYIQILRRRSALEWVIVAAAFVPIFVALLQGQDAIFFLLLIALTFVALRNGRDFTAGAWLGLGLFRFHLVLPLLFTVFLEKRRKTVLGFAVVAIALGLVSTAIVGWHGMVNYPAYIWRVEGALGRGAIVSADMPSIRGFVDIILGASLPQSFNIGLVALASITLFIFTAKFWKAASTGTRIDLGFSLCLIMTVLVSYHSFIYDLSLLALPSLILANYFQELRQADAWTRFALFFPAAVLFLSPLQIVLALRYGRIGLLVPVLLLWWWGIARLLARINRAPVIPLTA